MISDPDLPEGGFFFLLTEKTSAHVFVLKKRMPLKPRFLFSDFLNSGAQFLVSAEEFLVSYYLLPLWMTLSVFVAVRQIFHVLLF